MDDAGTTGRAHRRGPLDRTSRRPLPRVRTLALALVTATGILPLMPAQPASATPAGGFTLYRSSEFPFDNTLTRGPDGNMWYAIGAFDGVNPVAVIRRMTPSGVVAEQFRVPGRPTSMTLGPDGNFWLTMTERVPVSNTPVVVRATPTGATTRFPVSQRPGGSIVTGADGALWFTQGDLSNGNATTNLIGRLTTDGVLSEFPVSALASNVVPGPDGNMWFLRYTGVYPSPEHALSKITSSGVVTDVATVLYPEQISNVFWGPASIVFGADGLLYVPWRANDLSLDVFDTTGALVRHFDAASQGGLQAILGSDGNVWLSGGTGGGGQGGPPALSRITPAAGDLTQIPLPNGSQTNNLSSGPDGIWFIGHDGNDGLAMIGRYHLFESFCPSTNIFSTDFLLPTAGSVPQGIAPE